MAQLGVDFGYLWFGGLERSVIECWKFLLFFDDDILFIFLLLCNVTKYPPSIMNFRHLKRPVFIYASHK